MPTKKVSGIKRHIFIDSQKPPHVIVVTAANVTDRQDALKANSQHKEHLSEVASILVDGGYTGPTFALAVQEMLEASVHVA